MNDYLDIISDIFHIAREDIKELLNYAEPTILAKDDCLVDCGGFNDSLHIVTKGILRAFRSSDVPNQTLWFAFAGDIVVDMFCYCGKAKSPIGIQSETDVKVLVIPKKLLKQACQNSLRMANTVRRIFEHHALEFENCILSLWNCNDGMERYLSIMKRHPELLQKVPLKKLATYQLVTPQSLSRIRANIVKKR